MFPVANEFSPPFLVVSESILCLKNPQDYMGHTCRPCFYMMQTKNNFVSVGFHLTCTQVKLNHTNLGENVEKLEEKWQEIEVQPAKSNS